MVRKREDFINFDPLGVDVWPVAFRLTPQAVPAPDVCDWPLVCLRVNSAWASHLLGAIQVLQQPDMWVGTPEDILRAQDAIVRIEEMLAVHCPDDGMTLTTQAAYESTLSNLKNSYDGTPSSVNPDAPDDAMDADKDDTPEEAACRPSSLCAVVTVLVKQLIAAELRRRQGETTLLGLSGYVVGALNSLGWLTGPAAPAILIGGAILSLLGAALSALDNAQLNDQAAISEVICCILSNLYGKANTAAVLASACDPCDCFTEANSDDIAFAICPLLGLPDTWYIFQNLLADAQRGCANGLLDVCGCGEWCAVFDFSIDNGTFAQSVTGGADYVAGQYWNQHDYAQIGQATERRCFIRRGCGTGPITYLSITYDYKLGYQQPVNIAPDQSLYVNAVPELIKGFGDLIQGTGRVITWAGCRQLNNIDVRLTASKDFVDPKQFGGFCRIKKIVVKGNGTFPFPSQYLSTDC